MKEQFAGVKVGDKVWSINHGWGKASHIKGSLFGVLFENGLSLYYNKHGWREFCTDIAASLFWDEIEITPPPKPKREVVHTVERWVNIYPNGDVYSYADKTSAYISAHSDLIACVKLTGTYTTME